MEGLGPILGGIDWPAVGGTVLGGVGHILIWLLAGAGLLLSVFSISGTWLVLVGAALAAWWFPAGPGWGTLAGFAVLAGAVEVFDALAGSWGVNRRGGSARAGWAALFGGFAGLFLGAFIPVPLIGSLIGMMIGGFVCVFLVEHARLRQRGAAARIAWGSVLARVVVIGVKVLATLLMSGFLFFRLYL